MISQKHGGTESACRQDGLLLRWLDVVLNPQFVQCRTEIGSRFGYQVDAVSGFWVIELQFVGDQHHATQSEFTF